MRIMNETLVIALLDQLAFLELSSDDIIDPDAVVRQMENISAILGRVTDGDKTEFSRITKAYADKQNRKDRSDFFQDLPENLGLI